MNKDFFLKRKHIFKKRLEFNSNKLICTKLYTHGFFCIKQQFFEFVYIRVFKKLLRRKFIKTKPKFKKPKYWLFLKINFILSSKSKNARMGAGTGIFVRLNMILKKYYILLKTIFYSINRLKIIKNFLYFKCKLLLHSYYGWFFIIINNF